MSLHLTHDATGALRQQLTINGHGLCVDESVEIGGDASAPTPHDLFDAALASCKAITMTLYARHKGWPLTHVDVDIDRDDSEERQGKYRLNVTLTPHGELDDDQRARLLQIADRCPVHRLMTDAEVLITTRLNETEGAQS